MNINEVLDMGKELTQPNKINEEETGKDSFEQILHIGDYVVHISGGAGYSKLELIPGQVLGFKNGKVIVKKVSERGKSVVSPDKLIKTFGDTQPFKNLDNYDSDGHNLNLQTKSDGINHSLYDLGLHKMEN